MKVTIVSRSFPDAATELAFKDFFEGESCKTLESRFFSFGMVDCLMLAFVAGWNAAKAHTEAAKDEE